MALSIPEGVSCIRGVGSPFRGLRVIDLTTTAPIVSMSTNRWASLPEAKQPLAVNAIF
jgi:hypothetical protein